MKSIFILIAVLLTVSRATEQTIYAPQAYEITDNQKLQEVADLLKAQPESLEQKHGLVHLLHATLHQNTPLSFLEGGIMINELVPPVKVVVQRTTKARKIPHKDGEVARRIPAGSVLVAMATTPDMLWIQVGRDEFIPTKDANLEEPLNREVPQVSMLEPSLDIHVKADVTVRKIPDMGGKPVGQLRKGALTTAIGVTPDYAWMMIGKSQFIPTVAAKLGDPTTPLVPPLTVHLRRDTVVRDSPTMQGKPVTVLRRGDIMQATAVSADTLWLKIAHGNYIKSSDCKHGLPLPATVAFPRPLVVKLKEKTPIIKNPNMPETIVRWLKQDDELQVIGATADFAWLIVAPKRFIPMVSAQLKSPIPPPLDLNPVVPIKLSRGIEARDIPDERGHVLMILRQGEKYEADAISADFTWLRIGGRMWIPMTAAYLRKPAPQTTPLVPPIRVTLSRDTKVYKKPDYNSKVIRTLGEDDTLTAFAATPDLGWLKVGIKEYIPAEGVKLEDAAARTVPLFPPIRVVVSKDTVVYKSPSTDSLPARRLKRGEVLEIGETTPDMKWLKIRENEFIATEYAVHISHTVPLAPPVRVIVAADDLKVRNVPAFAGMTVKTLTKGETYLADEVSPDYRWIRIAKDQFIPVSGCVLHESEGTDMIVVLKIRSSHVDQDPVVSRKPEKKQDQTITTSQLGSLLNQAFEKRIHTPEHAPETIPTIGFEGQVNRLRIARDTLVMDAPSHDATVVRGIAKGALVNASGLGNNFAWLKIGTNEFVELDATEPTDVTKIE